MLNGYNRLLMLLGSAVVVTVAVRIHFRRLISSGVLVVSHVCVRAHGNDFKLHIASIRVTRVYILSCPPSPSRSRSRSALGFFGSLVMLTRRSEPFCVRTFNRFVFVFSFLGVPVACPTNTSHRRKQKKNILSFHSVYFSRNCDSFFLPRFVTANIVSEIAVVTASIAELAKTSGDIELENRFERSIKGEISLTSFYI